MEAWEDIVKGYIYFKKVKTSEHWQMMRYKFQSGEPTIPEWALIGDTQVCREAARQAPLPPLIRAPPPSHPSRSHRSPPPHSPNSSSTPSRSCRI